MSKAIIYTIQGTLQGAFTNKKKFWDDLLLQEKSVDKLKIKLSPNKISSLNYQKVVKYLKERTMLRIYKQQMLDQYKDNIEQCPSYINVWEVQLNQHYNLKEK